MIGIGKWRCGLDTSLIKNEGTIEIYDDNGKYGFRLLDKDKNLPDYNVEAIEEVGSDTLLVTITVPELSQDRKIYVKSTYTDNTMVGYIKIPIVGKIKITNGRRV